MSTAPTTIVVPGHPGWQGQQGSTGAVTSLGVLLGLAALAYGAILFADPAPSMKALGLAVVVTAAATAWLLIVQVRLSRVRVVRASASPDEVRFAGATETAWPLRVLGVLGLVLIGCWLWAVLTVPADRLSLLTLLLVPVVAASLLYGGGRAWLGLSGAHSLTLTPERLVLRIPRNALNAPWGDISGAQLVQNRVVVTSGAGGSVSWAARDLASDPVILADLVSFYAGSIAARAEIGEATLGRLQDGALPGAQPRRRPPMTPDARS
ncbi:hypothetical protein [Microbacterium sp. P05]|uniref:hypothetical protein n=1 Tax=Microbacterium sp. P05 TaxID=3366948 RepID=UPI0037466CE6